VHPHAAAGARRGPARQCARVVAPARGWKDVGPHAGAWFSRRSPWIVRDVCEEGSLQPPSLRTYRHMGLVVALAAAVGQPLTTVFHIINGKRSQGAIRATLR